MQLTRLIKESLYAGPGSTPSHGIAASPFGDAQHNGFQTQSSQLSGIPPLQSQPSAISTGPLSNQPSSISNQPSLVSQTSGFTQTGQPPFLGQHSMSHQGQPLHIILHSTSDMICSHSVRVKLYTCSSLHLICVSLQQPE